eukprot:6093409-Amphidinium_carterae.2
MAARDGQPHGRQGASIDSGTIVEGEALVRQRADAGETIQSTVTPSVEQTPTSVACNKLEDQEREIITSAEFVLSGASEESDSDEAPSQAQTSRADAMDSTGTLELMPRPIVDESHSEPWNEADPGEALSDEPSDASYASDSHEATSDAF